MCGIIGYFGDRANGLSRVLGAMASILYRAPDSTGAAWFGDEGEPLRIRKTVGALSRFVETQLYEGTHLREPEILASLWADAGTGVDRQALQKALLRWEGLSGDGREKPWSFHDLIRTGSPPPARPAAGLCGAAELRRTYRVESPEDLKRLILEAIEEYDLPPAVVRTLVRKTALEALRGPHPAGHGQIDEQSAAQMIDELFQQSLRALELAIPSAEPELDPVRTAAAPGAQTGGPGKVLAGQPPLPGEELSRQLFDLLKGRSIALPEDCSPDAARGLFRLLDGTLLSRLSIQPELREAVQEVFERRLPGSRRTAPWTALYAAERGLNVFGRAAEAAWIFLRTTRLSAAKGVAEAPPAGRAREEPAAAEAADEAVLRFLCPPIVAHGRWALQSPVSDENAHPFLDAEGRRAVVLNGQFSPAVETELRRFLSQMGFRFRSENSTEYLSMLWGHYYELFRYEQRRSRGIQTQVDSGLDGYNLGSQTIDYRVFSMIRDKSESELDALAFREAAAKMVGRGGQIAAAGISLYSPGCLFVASHNRPLFIVRRAGTEEIMAVSDINAALGLFSQKAIQEKARQLARLRAEHEKAAAELRAAGAGAQAIRSRREELRVKEELALQEFKVSVLPLQGEQKYALIESILEENRVRRRVSVTDFSGRPVEDIESFDTILNPLPGEQVYASFFESHLKEVPERLHDLLSAYVPEGAETPRLNLRRRILVRRFGQKLSGLKRLVLVGMGSSYHAGLMASCLCRELLPEVEVLLLRPVEVEHALRLMEPEEDLVILLSWSGTTADMVEFARELSVSKISFIVITNKPYSELGLFAWKSLGVVNLVSGEEVTFSAVKSTCSMLFGAQLLILWLSALSERRQTAQGRLRALAAIPESLENLADDPQILSTLTGWAGQSSASGKALVFDDLLYSNTGREAAWKLEENGRAILCRTLDYRDPLPLSLALGSAEFLVLVVATASTRLGEALELMKRLYLAGVRFYCFSYEHPQLEQVRFYCRDRVLKLPKMEDALQPFVDLLVMYRFTQCLIEEAGRGVPGFPRNRVKSVTTTRSRQRRFPEPAAELAGIRREQEQLARVALPDCTETTLWEKRAHAQWEREIYRNLRRTGELLSREDPLGALFRDYETGVQKLSDGLFDELGEGGELLFLCCDKTSWAAGYEAAAVWSRLLGVPLRIFYRLKEMHTREAPLPIAVLASEPPERVILDQFRGAENLPMCWIGPELESRYSQLFRRSLGYYLLSEEKPAPAYCSLYAGTLLLLTAAWQRASSGKGKALQSVLCSAAKVVSAVLEDEGLKGGIDSFWAQNRERETAFYVSPPSGIGYFWEGIFDATGAAVSLEHHVYGDSSHGPIAAVDPRVEEKYVRLRPRGEMVKRYGEEAVSGWQRSFGLPARWSTEAADDLPEELKKRGLFHVHGGWYLPVSEPGYEPSRDTTIILDASRARYYEQARDEVEVFTCRYARMLLISQEAFNPADAEGQGAAGSTAIQAVLFPALHPGGLPIPDLLLPFAMNAAAAAFAAGSLAARGSAGLTPAFTSREATGRLIEGRLLLLAQAFAAGGVELGSLDHRHLASLEKLAPLVRAVEGSVAFEVRRFSTEKRLLGFLNRQAGVSSGSESARSARSERPEEIVDHFRLVHGQGLKFFLMRASAPAARSAGGEQTFLDSEERSWQEVFGMSWEALNTGLVQIGEGKNGQPLIEVPLLLAGKREGRLLRLFVRYREWNHSQSLDVQIASTLEAMQRGMMSLKSQSPGYLTMVNSFNESIQASGESWADWLIALLPRSWLLYKPSQELAAILADRAGELVQAAGGGQAPLEHARRVLGSIWRSLGKIEQEEEPSRWSGLFGKLKQQL